LAFDLNACLHPDRTVRTEDMLMELRKAEDDSLMLVFDSLMSSNVKIPQLVDS